MIKQVSSLFRCLKSLLIMSLVHLSQHISEVNLFNLHYLGLHIRFQNITAHSSHIPSTTKSLFYNLLQTYKRQNKNREDFHKMGQLLFQQLQDRGHEYKFKLLFKESPEKINRQQPTTIKQEEHNCQRQHPISTYNTTHTAYHDKQFKQHMPKHVHQHQIIL